MNALVIDKEAQVALLALRKKAEENVVPFATMLEKFLAHTAPGAKRVKDPFPGHTVAMKVRYSCTFTIEEHRTGVPCRHLSVAGPNMFPHPDAVSLLMKAMGFQNDLLDANVWTEELEPEHFAVNVLEPVHGDWEPLKQPVKELIN